MPPRPDRHPAGTRPTPVTRVTPLAALLLGAVMLATSGCASRDRQVQQAPAESLYEQATRSLERGSFAVAIAYLEHLEARFPFTNEARQAQLDLIYAYYRNGQRESAIDAAEQFIRENPGHARVDYALYMLGVVNFESDRGLFDRWLRIDPNARPPRHTTESYAAFQDLVRRFPNSEYVPDARQRMVFLRNRLAAYEVHVARYYIRRQAYVAALNRARYCLERYAGAPQQREALEIMLEAYERLGMRDLAANTREVLRTNWPDRY